MAQNPSGRDESGTRANTLLAVLRVLDAENRLLERADQKAIALLSALGVFMVFFIVWHRLIPINAFTVTLLVVYFIVSLMAIVNLILTVRPRIHSIEGISSTDKAVASEPAFFAGICKFPTFSAYKLALQDMVKDEASTIDVYMRQIFSLAQINQTKYRNIRRAILFVVIALGTELALVAYLFPYYYFQGASVMPPLGG